MSEKLLLTKNLYALLDIEPFVLLGGFVLIAWLFYKIFLVAVSEQRHRNLRKHFKNLLRSFVTLSIFFGLFLIMNESKEKISLLSRLVPYVAFIAFILGNILFVKTCRLIVLMYMFLGSMKQGVPMLMVNIFSLILSALLTIWGVSFVFNVQLAPLLATSAAFSIILGLAMQDTLGNLFAGVSLQLDKNFEIGDWIEIIGDGGHKAIGMVKEISWRSTVLVGFLDEVITIPNRILAQSQISNYSPAETPVIRSQIFRLRLNEDIERAKEVLGRSLIGMKEIRQIPAPLAFVAEVTENWVSVKLIYYIDVFGAQYLIGDKVFMRGLEALKANNIELARQMIQVDSIKSPHEH